MLNGANPFTHASENKFYIKWHRKKQTLKSNTFICLNIFLKKLKIGDKNYYLSRKTLINLNLYVFVPFTFRIEF